MIMAMPTVQVATCVAIVAICVHLSFTQARSATATEVDMVMHSDGADCTSQFPSESQMYPGLVDARSSEFTMMEHISAAHNVSDDGGTSVELNEWYRQEVHQVRPKPTHMHLDVQSLFEGKGREVLTVAPHLVHLITNSKGNDTTDAIFVYQDSLSTAYLLPLGNEDRLWVSRPIKFSFSQSDGSTLDRTNTIFFQSICVNTADRESVIFFGGGMRFSPGSVSSDIHIWSTRSFELQKVSAHARDDSESVAYQDAAVARMLHKAVIRTENGSMYIFGGCQIITQNECTPLNDLWRFDFDRESPSAVPVSGSWTKVDSGGSSETAPKGALLPSMYYWNNAIIVYGGISKGGLDGGVLTAFEYSCNMTIYNLNTTKWEGHYTLPNHGCSVSGSDDQTSTGQIKNTGIAIPPSSVFFEDLQLLLVLLPNLFQSSEVKLYGFSFRPPKSGWMWAPISKVYSYFLPSLNFGLSQLTTTWPTVSNNSGGYILAVDVDGVKAFSIDITLNNVSAVSDAIVHILPCEPKKSFFGLSSCAFSSSANIQKLDSIENPYLAIGLTCNDYHPHEAIRIGVFYATTTSWTALYLSQPVPSYGVKSYRSPFTVGGPSPYEGYTTAVISDVVVIYGGVATAAKAEVAIELHNDVWCYNYTQLQWIIFRNTSSKTPGYRAYHSAVAFNQSVFIYGGYNEDQTALAELWQLRFTSLKDCIGDWLPIKTYQEYSRYGHSATVLGTNMFIIGGASTNRTGQNYVTVTPDKIILQISLSKPHELQTIAPTDQYGSSSFTGMAFHSAVTLGEVGIITMGGISIPEPCNLSVTEINRKQQTNGSESCITHNKMNEFKVIYPDQEDHNASFLSVSIGSATLTNYTLPNQSLMWHQLLFVNEAEVVVLFGGFYTDNYTNSVLSFRPACPKGYFSENITSDPCTLCPIGRFSRKPTKNAPCKLCPAQSTTRLKGSSSEADCNACSNETCSGNGDCVFDLEKKEQKCVCYPGYWSHDKCRLPYTVFIATASIVAILTFLLVYWLIRRHRENKLNAEEEARQLRVARKELSQLAAVYEIDSSQLTFRERLSSGEFGEVWLAEYEEMRVAVRRFKPGVHVDMDNVRREGQLIRHPNILLFIGLGMEDGNCPFLVVEHMQRGTLQDVLGDPKVNIDHVQHIRFALDIARGMRFLHGLEEPRIHLHLKSTNLLVDDRWVVKVADVGATRAMLHEQKRDDKLTWTDTWEPGKASASETTPLLNRHRTAVQVQPGILLHRKMAAPEYSAPEVLADKQYGRSADVYSFGIVMWEIICRCPPVYASTMDDIAEDVINGGRPIMPDEIPSRYSLLMTNCWKPNPDARPQFSQVVADLDEQHDLASKLRS